MTAELAERVPIRESALAWLDSRGLRLEQMTPDDLLAELRIELMDRDIVASGYDLSEAPF